MSKKKIKPGSLLVKKATGGEIAEHGFSFQSGMLLVRIPMWLAQSGFSQFIREALGDTEARFFVPGVGDCREFNEYKDHRLTPGVFWPEVDTFLEMETAHPGVFRKFRLVCAGVNEELRAICRALDRARRALPFYDGVSTVEENTFEELVNQISSSSGKDRAYAEFVFKKVDVDFQAPPSIDAGFVASRFHAELERALPECAELVGSQVRSVSNALKALIASKIAEPIDRAELVAAFRSAVPGFEFRTLDRIRLHTASESEPTWEDDLPLVLEWGRFSGRGSRSFPDSGSWNEGLDELIRVRDWIRASRAPRSVLLQGMRRLSASVAIGSVLSATGGFVIEVENRGELMRTNQHAGPDTSNYAWQAREGAGERAEEIAVVVSVKRLIGSDVETFLGGLQEIELWLHSDEVMTSAEQMNLAVGKVKELVGSVVSRTGATVIHLFLAVPGPFALFLGHRLNATCSIQCYEFIGPAQYVPTFRLAIS